MAAVENIRAIVAWARIVQHIDFPYWQCTLWSLRTTEVRDMKAAVNEAHHMAQGQLNEKAPVQTAMCIGQMLE